MNSLRTVFRIKNGKECIIQMKDLQKGDQFRMESDDPQDYVNQEKKIYTALSNAYLQNGIWTVQVSK